MVERIAAALTRARQEEREAWRDKVAIIHETVIKKWPAWSIEDARFLALALAGEVGELLNLLKKEWRGDGEWNEGEVFAELADIRIYLDLLARALGCNLTDACNFIVETKLLPRWPEAAAAIRQRGEASSG